MKTYRKYTIKQSLDLTLNWDKVIEKLNKSNIVSDYYLEYDDNNELIHIDVINKYPSKSIVASKYTIECIFSYSVLEYLAEENHYFVKGEKK